MPGLKSLRRRWSTLLNIQPPKKKMKKSLSCLSDTFKTEEQERIKHKFRHYYFHRPRVCFVCKQRVLSQGSACQVCRYICHRQCENQVMTSCVPQINNHDVKHETVNRYQYSTRDQFSGSPGMSQSSTLRNMITRAQDHHGNRDDDQLVLDLVYITERIISMSFPSDGHETTYQYNLNEVMNMLKQKHGDNCMVINVSEQRQDLQKVNTQRVVDYGWPAHLAPPLERLCNICKSMDSWLNSDPSHVAVIHCKGGQDRIAMVIAAFMHYCNICASSDQAMDRFAMKRFYDDKLSGILQPAQERYVQYFAGLLSGKIKINSNPLYLHHLVIHGVPNFDTKGGCRPFIKVYQGMQAIFTSGVYNVTDQMQKVCISISPGIPLRGDIMIKCFHKHNSGGREPIWTTQFHTCAISNMNVLFAKNELDEAKDDPRFPRIGKVEFVFGKSQDSRVLVHDFKSDVTVPVIDEDGLKRSESYENFLRAGGMSVDDMRDMAMSHNATSRISYGHAEGPVDGSLYATVHKRQHEFVDNSTILQNGNTQFQNGSQASSVDSGISASSGLVGNTSTSQYSSHARTSEPVQQQGYSTSNNTMKSSYSSQSTLPKKAATVDEQKELDMILSDLLNDQVFVTSPKSPPKSSHSSSNDTRTFRTYDTERGPDGKLTYRTAEVNYKVPEQQQQSYSYSTRTFNDDSKTYVPPNAFSYTPASPELARRTESSKTTTLPYSVRTDYEHQNGDQFSYSRSDADNSSWLQQQQQKLRERKDSKSEERQQQEKQLVDELRSAQNKYFTKRAQNEADEQAVMQTSFQQNMSPPPTMSNGPTTGNYSYSMNKTHTFSTDKSPEPPVRTYPTVQHHRTNTVERTEKTEIDKTRSLDELEKSLQAASNSIIATKPTWQVQNQQPQTGNQGFQKIEQTQRVTRKYETRTFETHNQQKQDTVSNEEPRSMSPSWDNVSPHVIIDQHQEIAAPRPKHINVVEEDRFSLRPIGPGMQPLEPEGIQTGTLPRSTTPSFPVSPVSTAVTPPFPITPRSPYYTMQATHQQNHQQHQQQQQTQQQTEHREYKYQTQHHYNQQPGQQFGTGSQQNVNMIEGMPPQNIPIQHQQGGSNFNTMSSTHGSVSSPQGFNTLGSNQSPQGFNTLGSNQSYRTESHDKYHTMGSTGSQDRFGTMGSQPETSRFTTLGSQQERFGTMGSQQDRFGTAGSQNFSTMSSGHQQQFGTMGSQQNGGTLHVDTRQGNMHSGPSSAGSPHSPETLNQLRQQLHVAHNMSSSSGGALSPGPHSMTGQSSPSVYFGLSRRGSLTSLADNNDAVHATPKFVKNTSKYWYMPNITREEAIQMLKDKSPGTFVVRDSNSFPGAFGLALKVATIPAGVQTKSSGDPAADLVRHFLIEPTPKGVRLRGCSNEPVFGSLASLVYQHSITPLALPCKLVLPEVDQAMESSMDMSHTSELPSSAAALLAQGAACNVLYINSIDTESLTGPQAVARALKLTSEMGPPPTSTVVHFKVSNQGITLTDNQRKLFFRRHYPVSAVTYCGMDPEGRKWKRDADIAGVQLESRVFGFVARKHSGASDNACHLFAELDPEQPASAIVNFVTKIMIGQSSKK